MIASRVDDFATVAIGSGSGAVTLAGLHHMLAGFVRALIDADDEHRFRGITICEIDEARFLAIRDELYRLCATRLFDDVEVTLRERRLPVAPAADQRSVLPAGVAPMAQPIYLMVRSEARGTTLDVRCSVLSSGPKAVVWSETHSIETRALDALLERLPRTTNALTERHLKEIGTALGALVLTDNVRRILADRAGQHVVVIHDAAASRIPWDAVHIDGAALVDGAGLSHRYEAENLSIAKWLTKRTLGERLNVLLAVDPTEDLEGARLEGKRIEEIFGALGTAASLEVLTGKQATKRELMRAMSSGRFDVLHTSGHSFFNAERPDQSGLLCSGEEVLSGADIAPLTNLPSSRVLQLVRVGARAHGTVARRGAGGGSAAARAWRGGMTAPRRHRQFSRDLLAGTRRRGGEIRGCLSTAACSPATRLA